MRINRMNRIFVSIILFLLILYLFSRTPFIANPIVAAARIIFVPIVLSFFLYYLLRPLVSLLHRWKLSKSLSILLIYFIVTIVVFLFGLLVWPPLQTQLTGLLDRLPGLVNDVTTQLGQLQKEPFVQRLDLSNVNLTDKASQYLSGLMTTATNYLTNAFSFVSSFIIIISTVPIILYYLLKDDSVIIHKLQSHAPLKFKELLKETLTEIDKALSGFIIGRVNLCLLLGGMVLIGFLIIDLPYPLVLALIIAAMNMIPYIGQLLGLIPCVIVAFIDSPISAVWVIIIVVIAQQIEGNILSPHIYGRKLDIHPITTILLVLVSGTFGGIIGILVIIPFYLIIKIITLKILLYMKKA